ncbi:MAG: fumarylacetoacetate hydrolase family protein [Myxococcales bacterium]|nr:fumarylacetoacetate hydrolase family protein [Myxococcales bacterium]
MKLATLDDGTRDGRLLVVSRDGSRASAVPAIAATLQDALDAWPSTEPALRAVSEELNAGRCATAEELDATRLHSPLPRAYEWIDGSAYINHIVLVRKARGAEPPETLESVPLVYQGGSGTFLRPFEPIAHYSEEFGVDFEAEIAVITDDVPMGTRAGDAAKHVRLVMLANDVSLRQLIPAELKLGFGFFVSKPSTAFSPFAVTPDELGESWRDGRLHLPLVTTLNGERFGDPDAGEAMHFSFHDLIAHVTQTRRLTAGTIIGSGTVSNEDRSRGSSCLAERRMLELIDGGEVRTPFLRFGDRVEIEMLDRSGRSIFGRIAQTLIRAERR